MSLGPAYALYAANRLEASPIFHGMHGSIMREMLGDFRRTTWRKGVMARPESLLKWFYLILDGRARVEVINARTGKPFTLSLLGPGDGFDVVTLLDGASHDVNTVAVNDLHLIFVPVTRIREWIRHHPEFNRNFLFYLGERMREMEHVSADLATSDTATRLARLILRNTIAEADRDGHHAVRLIHDLSHEAMARMIGSTRQVVNKHLQALRRKQVLNDQSGELRVKDLEALTRQAELFEDEQDLRPEPDART